MNTLNNKTRLLLFSLITVTPLLIFLNSLGNTFVYDDYLTITNNHFIRDWRYFSALFSKKYFAISNELTYRPTVTFSYFVDYALWQLRPWGYHLTNVLLHTGNVVLVYFMVCRLFNNRTTAFISCLIFSIHPVFTEAVNAISYREDLLCATFLLTSFILFHKAGRNRDKYPPLISYFLSLCAYFFALLSKEMAIVLPLLFIVYDSLFHKDVVRNLRNFTRRLATHYVGYVIISLLYLLLRFYIFYNPGEAVPYPGSSMYVNCLMMTKVLGYYIKLFFIPMPLNADYVVPLTYTSTDAAFLVSVILLTIVIILFVKQFRSSRILAFSILWFFITLMPVLNIIPINNIMAERYLYFPGIGFAILFGSMFTRADKEERLFVSPYPEGNSSGRTSNTKTARPFRIVLITVICLLFTWGTLCRNRIWLNEFTFSTETLRRSPGSFRIYNDLGYFYYHSGMIDAAIQSFKDSIGVRFGQPKAHCNLGAAYSLKGNNDAAIAELKTAIRIRNEYPEAHNNLGILYKRMGKLDEAVNEYGEALKVNPYYADAHNNLGSALIDQGKLDEAFSEVEKAIQIQSNFALAHYNMAVVYFKKGQPDKAYNKLLEACQLDPTNADVHISLGVLYKDYFHNTDKALTHIREALRLNPKHKQAEEMKQTINKLTKEY